MSRVMFIDSTDGIQADQLRGLPAGWPNPPSPETNLKSLQGRDAVVLAVEETGQVAGYVCGLSDDVLILYVWTVEVLPEYRGELEKELLLRLLDRYGGIYQVNAHPDDSHRSVFEELGLVAYRPEQAVAMTRMDMTAQDGGSRAA